jgi:hypothetical protein
VPDGIPINYNGPSMKPLLRPGDGLVVNPNRPFSALRKGDVICFESPQKPIHVTHRVVGITPQGLRTAGDYNPTPDPFVVTPDQHPLLVTHARRGRRIIRIHGGTPGSLIHYKNQLRARLLRRILWPLKFRLEAAFVFLAQNGGLGHLALLDKHLSLHRFNQHGRELVKIFYN